MTLYEIATRALPADALCGLDERDCASVDRIARAIEASGYGEATAHRTAILRAIGEHLRATYDDARDALRWLASLDCRLAVWGACACARTALRYVRDGEERPRRAVETTERWLAGQATIGEVRSAANAASAAAACDDGDDIIYSVSGAHVTYHAAAAAADAADAADAAATATKTAAAYGAAAAADAVDAAEYSAYHASFAAAAVNRVECDSARISELRRLVGVVADAMPGMPPEVLS